MDSAAAPDSRAEGRSNIFVMGTLYAAGGSMPVRIRNLSRTGALVEAAELPAAGTAARLCRGTLSGAGEIMWIEGRKAGFRFASPISAADWLPLGERGHGQQLIDEVIHRARLGSIPVKPMEPPSSRPPSLQSELLRLQHILHRAAEQLAADQPLSASHIVALQAIDEVCSGLSSLGAGLNSGLGHA
ncbi:MAG TPA: PilZ domain-containing protein [Sphingomicrobium sp.]|nr:PilZ domain-containing protein [Sphingomicrobium sp.]